MKRLDGTWRGWLWMIGWALVAFGGGLWAIVSFARGEFLLMDLILAPALTILGLLVLGARFVLLRS